MCTDVGKQKEILHFVEGGRETLGRFGSMLILMANYFRVDALAGHLCKGMVGMKEPRKGTQSPQPHVP